MDQLTDFLRWVGEKYGAAGLITALWILDRWRLEKVLDRSYERYITLCQTTVDTLAKIQTIILERLPRHHDTE